MVRRTLPVRHREGPPRGLLAPWGAQRAFLKSGGIYNLMQAGQGAGKTVAGVFQVRRYVKKWPGARVICSEPTYGMIRDILKVEFDRQFEEAGEDDAVLWRQGEYKYYLSNGSEIWLRQCDQFNRLRGPSVAAVYMDEAAQCHHDAFQILSGRMRQSGYPPMFLLTTTPRGKNWLHWSFTDGARPKGAAAYLGTELPVAPRIFRASALMNPYLPDHTKAVLRAAYQSGTRLYDQEVRGLTVVFEGLVFDMFEWDKHVQVLPVGDDAPQFVRIVGGVDWGWTNPGALSVLGLTADDAIWKLDEKKETRRSIDWWADEAEAMGKKWGVRDWFCDPSEPEHIARFDKKQGIRAHGGNNRVLPSITEIGSRLGSDRFVISAGCPKTAAEYGTWEWKQTRSGEIRADEPEDGDNHLIDSDRYAIMGIAKPRRAFVQ